MKPVFLIVPTTLALSTTSQEGAGLRSPEAPNDEGVSNMFGVGRRGGGRGGGGGGRGCGGRGHANRMGGGCNAWDDKNMVGEGQGRGGRGRGNRMGGGCTSWDGNNMVGEGQGQGLGRRLGQGQGLGRSQGGGGGSSRGVGRRQGGCGQGSQMGGGGGYRSMVDGNNGNGMGGGCSMVDNMVAEGIEDTEVQHLTFMREEEKMARDLYRAFYQEHRLPIFGNIAQAENRHMDAVWAKMQVEGMTEQEDPARGKGVGVFTNDEIQALYDNTLATGLISPIKALQMGALVEERDISDLALSMANTVDNKPGLNGMYENLMSASKRHLNAFARVLGHFGEGPYKAQYMNQFEVDAILGSETGTGFA